MLRADLRDTRGLPEPFYQPAMVKEIYGRYASALARIDLQQQQHAKAGKYNALHVLSYLDEASSGALYT